MSVRLYPAERLMLLDSAQLCGLSLSEFVRAAVAEKCERVESAYAAQLDAFVSELERRLTEAAA